MMWLSSPSVPPNQNVAVSPVQNILCPVAKAAIDVVLQSLNLDPAMVIRDSAALNGCSRITPLPNPTTFVRVAYKWFFHLSPADWSAVSNALNTGDLVREMHTMCDSTVYWQTVGGVNTITPASAVNYPQWLSQAGATCFCYRNTFEPVHTPCP